MTINLYDAASNGNRMEFFNNGENDANVMPVKMDFGTDKERWFNLDKDDARELIKYLKKQFKFSVAEL